MPIKRDAKHGDHGIRSVPTEDKDLAKMNRILNPLLHVEYLKGRG